MKQENVYRFSLQFGMDTTDKIRAGEFLEKLGNKKSAVVVAALNEYLEQHPEAKSETLRIQVEKSGDLRKEKLEQLIRSLIQEQIEKANKNLSKSGNESYQWEDLEECLQYLTYADLNEKIKNILSEDYKIIGKFPDEVFLLKK